MNLLNTQKYSECQLVAVINAATFLGEPRVNPNSEEYERLVDLVGARNGSALKIGAAVTYLRLIQNDITPVTLEEVRMNILRGNPVQVAIQHPARGFHSILLTRGTPGGAHVSNLFKNEGRLTWPQLRGIMKAVPAHCRKAAWYELNPVRIREKAKKK